MDSSGNEASVTREIIVEPDAFTTRWDTDGSDYYRNREISFFVHEGEVDFTIDWGDGSSQQISEPGYVMHSYANAGKYTVKMYGTISGIYFNELDESSDENLPFNNIETPVDAGKLQSVDRWGGVAWQTMERMLYGSGYLSINATDTPNLSGYKHELCIRRSAVEWSTGQP